MAGVSDQVITDRYALYCGDACEVTPGLPESSVGLSVFSPPFADLYSYSDSPRDLGNSRGVEEFKEHFAYLASALHRAVMPGRIVAVHCMDMPTFKRNGEEIGLCDFPSDVRELMAAAGFTFHARVVIWKDPLVAAVRTHAVGLAHQQIVKDSAMCRTGIADQVLAFRKPGANPRPVKNEGGLKVYHGERQVPKELDRYLDWKDPATNKRSHWIWQQYASPVWFDVRQTHVLPYQAAREQDDQRHICPLQLDVIERCVALWSAPGDVVFTPFMGVGSEVYVAVRNGRKGVGVELKRRYYRQAVRNVAAAAEVKVRKKLTEG